jgi:hypothetical protein
MKVVGVQIAWLMVLVALVALNFAAIRSAVGRGDRFNELWVMGALPMANALAISLFAVYGHRRHDRFRLGFEVFGAAALSLHVAGRWLGSHTEGLHFRLFTEFHGLSSSTLQTLIWDMIPPVMTGLSQLAFALVGGCLFPGFRIR